MKNLVQSKLTTLKQILVKENGPFRKVSMNGDFEWHGVHQANEFWNQFEGSRKEGERIMRGM